MAIAGKVAITPGYEWSDSVAYDKLVVVTYNNNVYLSTQPSTGIEPTNTEYWMLLIENVTAEQYEAIVNGTTKVGKASTADSATNASKVNGITLYKSFTEIDSTYDKTTPIIDLTKKMASPSKLSVTVWNGSTDVYPTSSCVLEVDKTVEGYISLKCTSRGSGKFWSGVAQGDVFTGWFFGGDGGNADTVDGKHASEFALKTELDTIATRSSKNISSAGWYRVASFPTDQYGVIGAYANSCVLKIKKASNNSSSAYHEIHVLVANGGNVYFKSVESADAINNFTQIRYTTDSNIAYLEVYYQHNTANDVVFMVEGGRAVGYYWRAIEPVATSETVDGVTVVKTYTLPSNAVVTPATTADLANYFKNTGGVLGDGTAEIVLGLNGNKNQSLMGLYKLNTLYGMLGLGSGNVPVYIPADWSAEYPLLHSGNSAKVAIQESAPSDTTVLWVDTTNKKVKAYIDGAWTAMA